MGNSAGIVFELDGPLFRPVVKNRTGTLERHLDLVRQNFNDSHPSSLLGLLDESKATLCESASITSRGWTMPENDAAPHRGLPTNSEMRNQVSCKGSRDPGELRLEASPTPARNSRRHAPSIPAPTNPGRWDLDSLHPFQQDSS
jgi:hypothetical protein